MKITISSFVILASLTALAAEPTATAVTIGSSPTSVCEALVEGTKNKNFAEVMKWTTDKSVHSKKMKKEGFEKMGQLYFEKVQDLTCGAEIVAQDHAIVESESKGQKRLIPFIKTTDGWRFDLQTYRSFYQPKGEESPMHKM